MSQELAQDEAEADAEDYEIGNLENGHQRLATHDDDDGFEDGNHHSNGHAKGVRGRVGEENVVFAMGDDSDEEGSESGRKPGTGYRDEGGTENREGERRGKGE